MATIGRHRRYSQLIFLLRQRETIMYITVLGITTKNEKGIATAQQTVILPIQTPYQIPLRYFSSRKGSKLKRWYAAKQSDERNRNAQMILLMISHVFITAICLVLSSLQVQTTCPMYGRRPMALLLLIILRFVIHVQRQQLFFDSNKKNLFFCLMDDYQLIKRFLYPSPICRENNHDGNRQAQEIKPVDFSLIFLGSSSA